MYSLLTTNKCSHSFKVSSENPQYALDFWLLELKSHCLLFQLFEFSFLMELFVQDDVPNVQHNHKLKIQA